MTVFGLFLLAAVFLLTSIISVVTGSTSLITVPAMLQFGIDPRSAVATNMFALIWLSVGGTMPFIGKISLRGRRLPLLLSLTFAGSAIGALLVLVLPTASLPLIISLAMLGVTVFFLLNRNTGLHADTPPPPQAQLVGYALTFVLGIYGGLFSGGYVTMLTAVYIALLGMTFVEAVAITKIINIVSSGVATAIFMARGVVDYRLGVILGIVMLVGAMIGGRVTLRLSNVWLRRIFLATVVALALKTLLYDVVWRGLL